MANLDEKEVLSKTVFAEARGEPTLGQIGVLWVIINRSNTPPGPGKSFAGKSLKEVCLQPEQFECWWDHEKQRVKSDIDISSDVDKYREIYHLVGEVLAGLHEDPTGGADHYNNPAPKEFGGEGHKKWTENCNETVKIGHHQFYKQK